MPGPWKLADSTDNIIVGNVTRFKNPTPKGINLACVAIVDDSADEYEDMANARLIAAAPELLSALKQLYEETADYIRTNHLGDVHHNCSMQYARDAINKATGQTESEAP